MCSKIPKEPTTSLDPTSLCEDCRAFSTYTEENLRFSVVLKESQTPECQLNKTIAYKQAKDKLLLHQGRQI